MSLDIFDKFVVAIRSLLCRTWKCYVLANCFVLPSCNKHSKLSYINIFPSLVHIKSQYGQYSLCHVCVCVCVCRRCIPRTFIRRRAGFREHFFFRELPPRTCSISTLHVRIGFRRSLAKFGKRPLNTCFPRRSFNPSLKTTDYSANLRMR